MSYDRTATRFATCLAYIKDNTVRFHTELHDAACDAIYLACKDGRANWLNELYAVLTPIHQGAFRAWLVSDVTALCGNSYLKFTAKPGVAGQYFTVKPQTVTLRAMILPLIDPINDDAGKAFFVKTVKDAAKEDKTWNEAITAKIGSALALAMKANDKQVGTVPTGVLAILKTAMADIKALAPAPATPEA